MLPARRKKLVGLMATKRRSRSAAPSKGHRGDTDWNELRTRLKHRAREISRWTGEGWSSPQLYSFLRSYADFDPGGPILTEREYIEAALAFANGDPNAEFLGWLDGVRRDPKPVQPGLSQIEEVEKDFPNLRTELREGLTYLTQNDPEHRRGTVENLTGWIAIFPVFRSEPDGLKVQHRILAADTRAGMHYALALLLDPSRPYGKDLCQCQLEECGRFFFQIKPPTGRPQRRYCCSDHMDKAHELNSGERVRKSRERRRARQRNTK